MENILALLITLAIFIIFAINKSYLEIIVFLIVCLVVDWAVVKTCSTIPVVGAVAVSVGTPILSLLIYGIVSLVSLGIFYAILQRYNYIVSIIAYLIINLIINSFYVTISGNILIDLFFNFIIGIIIIIAYEKFDVAEETKWFAIIGMVIETILRFVIGALFF